MIDYIEAGSTIAGRMVEWRQDIHSFPELAFNEHRTAAKVSALLRDHGLEVHEGIAGTGVVGVLRGRRGDNGPAVMFRADMDALPVAEHADLAYRSQHEGTMHACGHDGHTAMLLGAACHLAQYADFAGRLYFVFQPAEENFAGAKAMLDDRLLERFPAQLAFGIHNWPELPAGHASVSSGAIMASHDTFDITIDGVGCHAANPHEGKDVVLAAAQLVSAMHSIVSRSVSPVDSCVVSVTAVSAGASYNALPAQAAIKGTVRYLDPKLRPLVRGRIDEVTRGIATLSGCAVTLDYVERYPPTVNSLDEAGIARQCLADVPGIEQITIDGPASMCSEDFSFVLERIPGCYIWLGNGSERTSARLHSPHYDFNDDILMMGANFFVSLTNRLMT
jgi:hippurate hydrolase